jgi:conjugal transfer ATP-binding protein TraC
MAGNKKLFEAASKLAFNIREFTSQGVHARFFTGPSTFDIRQDEFVVLELEHLKVQPELYRVVTLLVINAVTQDLYLSDRSRPRLIIFDEAWQFMGEAAMLAPVISEGYRRARKYQGSFMVITQSLFDSLTG